MKKGVPAKHLPPASKGFNAADYARPGLSTSDVEEIKAGFDLFDTDQGGSIDTKQLKAAMVSLGFDSKNALIFQMISDLDDDGSGQIQFDEWLYLMTHKVDNKSSRDRVDKVFSLYDDEKTGYLSVKNLRRVAQDLGIDVPETQLQQMIDRADTDRDGLVSADQFYVILTRAIRE